MRTLKIREFGGFLKGSAVAAAAFVLSSCFETKQEFVLNPDGSGKVRHECAFQNVSLNGEAEPGEEALKEAVLQLLDKSKGVEAWKDVEFKYLDDGRIWFGGTAYFKDLNKLEIENQALLKFSWADGVLELDMEEGDGEEPSKKPGEVNLKAERAKYQQSRPMLAAMLGGMKHRVAFELPGKVEESSNFEKEDGGGLSIGFEGAKMLEVMDKLVADDEWLREQGFEAQEGPEFDNRMCGMLFGEEAPVRAKVGASKPLFDYVREVAAAKEGMAALMKSLGAPQPVAPAEGGGLEDVRVVGSRHVEELDKGLGLRPFYQEPGWTLSVYAKLPGSILDVTDESRVEAAVASDGSSLLKGDRDWDLRLQQPKLSKDGASVLFEVNLKKPGEGVSGLKELSGVMSYRVSGKTKKVDLGFDVLEKGAKGGELGAVLEDVGDGKLELKVNVGSKDLVGAWLRDEGGLRELSRRGSWGSNRTTTFTFETEDGDGIPEKGTVVLELHDGVKVFEAPFKLENIDLLGNPMK